MNYIAKITQIQTKKVNVWTDFTHVWLMQSQLVFIRKNQNRLYITGKSISVSLTLCYLLNVTVF